MALNLGAALRDAIDGPGDGLDGVVGEDPADVDLPALSARIRHRRRTRAATRSAMGVAAAGALAFVGLNGGLDGRGAQTNADPPAVVLSPGERALCGQDVATMPATDDTRLLPTTVTVISDDSGGVGTAGDPTDLGTFVGRTLTAALVQDDADATGKGAVVLTKGGTVVATTGDTTAVAQFPMDGTVDTVAAISADLAPCPAAESTANVPAGTYTVQYLVSAGDAGTTTATATPVVWERSAAGPWLVTLLDAPPAVALPDGFPADEVPVVSGKLLAAVSKSSGDGWVVQVAVDGDDALTRAARALQHAGATVALPTPGLVVQAPDGGTSSSGLVTVPDTGTQQELQARRDAALAEAGTAQRAYDELLAAKADPDTIVWAARQLQAAKDEVAAVQEQIAVQASRDEAGGSAAASRLVSYAVVRPTYVAATTATWSVDVTQSPGDDHTILTYSLTRR